MDDLEGQNDNQSEGNAKHIEGENEELPVEEKSQLQIIDEADNKPTLSSTISTGSSPPPPLLLRARAGVVTSRPGAMYVPGTQQTAGVQDDEESLSPGDNLARPQSEILLNAELVVQTPLADESNTDITAEVTPAPMQTLASAKLSSQPALVHAEPLQEPHIGLKEIWRNRTVRIAVVVCLVLFAVILTAVVTVVVELQKQNDHGPMIPLHGNETNDNNNPQSGAPVPSPAHAANSSFHQNRTFGDSR
jgi:hypothetical protein